MPWDIDGLLAGFTDDCVVRFGDIPEFRGKAPLERLFRARSERQRDYRLRKELRALMGDTIVKLLAGVDHVGLGSDMRGSTGPSVFDSYRDRRYSPKSSSRRGSRRRMSERSSAATTPACSRRQSARPRIRGP